MTRRVVLAMALWAWGCGDDGEPGADSGASSTAGGTTASDETSATTSPAGSDDAMTGSMDSGGSMPLPPYCGDGQLDPGEDCDDGNLIDHDGCTNACTVAACGDGVLSDGEECDDGNRDVSDDCTDCNYAYCGDGFLHPSETCDDGNGNDGDDCVDCEPATCGDGEIHSGVEQCDGMELAGETCESMRFVGGTLACDAQTCEFDTSGCTTMPASPGNGPRALVGSGRRGRARRRAGSWLDSAI